MTLIFALFVFSLLVLANACASLVPSSRKFIQKYDVLKLVGQWTFFSNSPRTLFSDVEIVITSPIPGKMSVMHLSKMEFPHVYPFFDPYRRYWRIIYEHTLYAKTESIPGPHTIALQKIARSIVSRDGQIDTIEVRIIPVSELKF